jgi:hypothetical protein
MIRTPQLKQMHKIHSRVHWMFAMVVKVHSAILQSCKHPINTGIRLMVDRSRGGITNETTAHPNAKSEQWAGHPSEHHQTVGKIPAASVRPDRVVVVRMFFARDKDRERTLYAKRAPRFSKFPNRKKSDPVAAKRCCNILTNRKFPSCSIETEDLSFYKSKLY